MSRLWKWRVIFSSRLSALRIDGAARTLSTQRPRTASPSRRGTQRPYIDDLGTGLRYRRRAVRRRNGVHLVRESFAGHWLRLPWALDRRSRRFCHQHDAASRKMTAAKPVPLRTTQRVRIRTFSESRRTRTRPCVEAWIASQAIRLVSGPDTSCLAETEGFEPSIGLYKPITV